MDVLFFLFILHSGEQIAVNFIIMFFYKKVIDQFIADWSQRLAAHKHTTDAAPTSAWSALKCDDQSSSISVEDDNRKERK